MPSGKWLDPNGYETLLQDSTDSGYAQLVGKKLAQGWTPLESHPPPLVMSETVAHDSVDLELKALTSLLDATKKKAK